MIDKTALILLAHSDWRTLMAFYALLDAEGYFVAPCYSEADLLAYCSRYKPELVITSDPVSGQGGGRLLQGIQARSPRSRILVLPDGVREAPSGAPFESGNGEELLHIVETLRAAGPPLGSNGH